MTDTSFASLATLNSAQLENLQRMGYTSMTAIQQQSLPAALAGNDIRAQAKTGSGKTAAFGIPLLQKLNPRFFGVQALVLCPTRELSTQVAEELRKLARFQANLKVVVLCGGVSIGPQIASLEHGAHVVVGTPGRIQDHLRKNTLRIDQVETLVLDEADRMLDMGFADAIQDIAALTPKSRQTLLFSATYPDNIEQLSSNLQRNPVAVTVESVHQASSIEQHVILCERGNKDAVMARALQHFDIQQAVVFCNTKQAVEDTTHSLRNLGYLALALHGDLEQRDRDEVYARFKQNSAHFLVATDVAARGLDVDDLQAVINYELPRDPEVYVHRIGRTGRAGKQGLALSLATDKEDYKRTAIADQMGQHIPLLAADELTGRSDICKPPMVTLCLAAGRKDKLRPGDILGALTGKGGIDGKAVGKIDVLDYVAYVAIERSVANVALAHLQQTRIKNRAVRVRRV
ncbi:ATP-dependent RNA helicase DbpA [Venatoribacter cucullus]|uniref:ATP-dependent RNA helicase DbpA n=1 Tax=Venatoribacter cucullus TaxID=2661630 RepID=UPI002240C4FA|nr:ATP-dependent RNA helicase DbpA [Venatoribacter cucullus]UZK03854.1 ATP-dependent RNA helicase DbpA [Venatoribacter cucullus]